MLLLHNVVFQHPAQNRNQHDPEFYVILLNFIKFYEFYGPETVML
jgi:hypothetical protein